MREGVRAAAQPCVLLLRIESKSARSARASGLPIIVPRRPRRKPSNTSPI
jgi:hypothetical protein